MLKLNRPDLFRQQCYLNGEWVEADSGKTTDVFNPATGEKIGTIPEMGTDETHRAIAAANKAWRNWRDLSAKQRGDILHRWFELMTEHTDDLALIMTLEQGKPLAEARGEIAYGSSYFEWYAEEGKRAYGDVIPSPSKDQQIVITKEPIGVCTAITPWNFPTSMITRKAGAALGAGCPIVIKPAPATPYSALALAVLAEEAGVPAGIFSVITGDAAEIGAEMTSNPIVRKVSFTGSTAVGRLLMKQCAESVKKVTLELGGNAPFIVFDDADLDAAVKGAMASKFRNSGQTCVCANRFYVHADVYEEFSKKLTQAVSQLKVGNGLDEGITQGPLINHAAVTKVEELVEDAVSKGATTLLGGKSQGSDSLFFEPTVLTNMTTSMRVSQEEIFGPVAPLFKFSSDEEVIHMANDTKFGLASYFYSRDIGRVWRVAEALEYGIVGINTGLISNAAAPFGGVKQSGLGREGSSYGLDDYLVIKYMCMGGLQD